jgi:hypothetical protein
MRAPLLLELPHQARPHHDNGEVAASEEHEQNGNHSQPRLALYASTHDRTWPRWVGPAPRRTWQQRAWHRLYRILRRETAS